MVQLPVVEPNEEEKLKRETVLKQVWVSCVNDEFGLANLIQTKADFSLASALVDRLKKEELMAVTDKTDVRQVEDWRRAFGSIQHQSCATDRSTWKPSGARKRMQFWKPSVGFVQMCWISTIGLLDSPWY